MELPEDAAAGFVLECREVEQFVVVMLEDGLIQAIAQTTNAVIENQVAHRPAHG